MPFKAASSAAGGAGKATECPSGSGNCFVAGTQVVMFETDPLFANSAPTLAHVVDTSSAVSLETTDPDVASWGSESWSWLRENRQLVGAGCLLVGAGMTALTASRRLPRKASPRVDLIDAALDDDDDLEGLFPDPWRDPDAWDWATDLVARFGMAEPEPKPA